MAALVTVTRRKPGVPPQSLVEDRQLSGWIDRGCGWGHPGREIGQECISIREKERFTAKRRTWGAGRKCG